jgi:hypothetical protein
VQGYIHTLIDGGIEDQDVNMLYLQKAAKSLTGSFPLLTILNPFPSLKPAK